jgi:Peptidase family M28/PA domain
MHPSTRTLLILVICATFFSPQKATAQSQTSFPPQELLNHITPNGIRAQMEFLADDLLEGRGPGTRGYNLAANYVRAQFEQMGLDPAGENGTYFQNIHLRQVLPAPQRDSLVIKRAGIEEKFVFEKDYLMSGNAAYEDTSVEAPLVFAGFGVTAPERNYDDYAGIDAKGKIVVLVADAPASFPSSDRALYADTIVKSRNAAAHGAVGIMGIWVGQATKNTPWSRIIEFFNQPLMFWIDANGVPNDYVPELKSAAFMNEDAGRALVKGSPHTLEEAMANLLASKPLSFPLNATASLHEGANFKELQSPNVAGLLRGSDDKLKDEYVIFTAHLDHVGIGEPRDGDSIYNGAVDNASGTAAVLEIARAFAETQPPPKRSVVFVAVTGEEAGLLGSDYYAQHPTVPRNQIAANINMDGISLFYEFKDIVALGADHSTLNDQVNDVARHMNLEVSPDPMPEENFFIRSDQYSFVKQGIPALTVSEGFKTVDPSLDGKKISVTWMTSIYHTPQDDMKQPLNFKAAQMCTRVLLAIGYEVAQAPIRPAWNSGDIFGQRFAHH